jgi:glycosyltransferase involved in cell wall biosynthesis
MNNASPLVSIVTPVYNGEKYLPECIESVLNQSWQNWEYILLDNGSTDSTGDIIRRYAEREPRIRVHTNERTVDVIQNHNIAFGLISPEGAYCKLIQADDWMFPECVERMVEIAEAAPSVGAVGSYCLAGRRVECDGLPYPSPFVPGKDLGRDTLLGKIYLFWSPSCLLLRSELVRKRQPFYRSSYLHADVEALYDMLREHDFGFVHQVLTYIRAHERSMTAQDAKRASTQRLSRLHLLAQFGREYLDPRDYEARLDELFADYYRALAQAVLDRRQADFWEYQTQELHKLGYPMSRARLLGALLSEVAANPREATRRLRRALAAGT